MKERYALENPISVLLDKPREEFTRRDLLRVIEEKQIERITLHYTGLDGKLKELKIPLANRDQADHILADGERADGSSLFKGMVDASVSDLYVVPLYKTAFLNPFDANSLDFICRYIDSSGSYASFAPDNILLNAHAFFQKSTGFTLNALGELEFYLLAEPESHIFLAGKQRGYHASAPFIKTGKVLDEMVRYITQITGAVKYAHSEVGYLTAPVIWERSTASGPSSWRSNCCPHPLMKRATFWCWRSGSSAMSPTSTTASPPSHPSSRRASPETACMSMLNCARRRRM